MVTEEVLIGREVRGLTEWIAQQPSWSDFPFILLLAPGTSAEASAPERDALQAAGNLTLRRW